MDFAGGGDVLSFPVVSVARSFSWRDCSGVVGIVLLYVDSIGRDEFGDRGKSGGSRG